MNKTTELVFVANPEAKSDAVLKEAVTTVVLGGHVSEDEVCIVDFDDCPVHGLRIHHNGEDLCYIDKEAIAELVPTAALTCATEDMQRYFKDIVNMIEKRKEFINLPTMKPTENKHRKNRKGRYTKHRIRFRGKPWMDSDDEKIEQSIGSKHGKKATKKIKRVKKRYRKMSIPKVAASLYSPSSSETNESDICELEYT